MGTAVPGQPRNGSGRSRAQAGGSLPRVTIGDVYRGRARLGLIRDLALNEWTHAELAHDLGVKTGDVAAFAAEHADEITEVRAALAGKLAEDTAGLWITKKRNRIAEIQSDFEDTEYEIARLKFETAANLGVGSRRHYNLNRIRLALLRAVADELEPRRVGGRQDGNDENVVHYVIEADDMTASLS